MSTHKEYALIAILATIAVVGVVPAFAQWQMLPSGSSNPGPSENTPIPITVSTDKAVYDHNSIIMVSGHVRNPYPGQQLTLRVSDSSGSIVQVSQLIVDNNGDFGTKLTTASPLWTKSGVYTIFAQYGNQQGTSAKVQFTIPGGGAKSCDPNQLAATLNDEVYCIPYSINGGTVLSGTLSVASKTLTVNIQANDDGQITLNIPRSVLDSKSGNNDQSFVVLVDGEEKDTSTETTTSDTRTVTISFTAGVGEIEIIGTQIVPEFGPIAALVLAIAIISIIAVSAKTGLRFMPKY
ncbi:MAG: PEFG-CTERM sorting domain-containing protein [Thaumarchaeota archaeon]|nr:PEFG-CTERM sorting domain-containing protein [Nitrososphaerota archaeon]